MIGHEFVGTVDDVGTAVTSVVKGDRVLVSGVIGCGSCPPCRALPGAQDQMVEVCGEADEVELLHAGSRPKPTRGSGRTTRDRTTGHFPLRGPSASELTTWAWSPYSSMVSHTSTRLGARAAR